MMDQSIVQAYSQEGGDLPYFAGRQYGGGWLRTIGRFAFPLLKKAMNIFGNAAQDVLIDEKPVLTSILNNAVKEFKPSPPINTTRKRKVAAAAAAPFYRNKRGRRK